jgi:polyphosphate kinase
MNSKKADSGKRAHSAELQDIYLNRELSQLAFNRRVLAQAEDHRVPLLERLRYLCIVSSNLDEFFEVRIASLLAQNRGEGIPKEPPALSASMERMNAACHQIIERQYEVLNTEILPELA